MGEFLPLIVNSRVPLTITSPPGLYAGSVFIVFVDFSPFFPVYSASQTGLIAGSARAIAQIYASISRAIAVVTTFAGLPHALSL